MHQLHCFNKKTCIGNHRNFTKKNSKLIKKVTQLQISYRLLKENESSDSTYQYRNLESQQIIPKYFFRSTNIFKNARNRCIRILRNFTKKTSKLRNKDLETHRTTIELSGIIIEIVQSFLRNAFEISRNKFSNLRSCTTTCKTYPNCHFICE